MLARQAPAQGEVYNIASGRPLSLVTLGEALLKAAEVDADITFTGELRPGDPLRWDGDSSRARGYGATSRYVTSRRTPGHGLMAAGESSGGSG